MHEVIRRFATVEAVDAAFAELCALWDELLSKYRVESSDERLNRMVNIWNQYQCMITFCMSRSASFFESGIGRGMGFRDSNQDLVGFVHQILSRARQRIIDIASTQFPDGGCYHQYQPLTKRGNNDTDGVKYPKDVAADESYLDRQPSYASNEVTINWNVTLFALSAGIDALTH